ncbi:MAG: amino acid adenylation domain-containing protein, partial [Herpetosiphonaceae bacterium]|nr:amino acid adenylation domain-containing protein [Herpetosiphonaceae bacterium]
MTDLEHQLAGLSPERRKLLEILLQKQAASAASDKDTAPRPNASSFPVSFAQQRLWFLDQFEPDSPLYNIILALRVQGKLDTTALANSINVIIARHAVLRTTFAVVDGGPVQVVAPHLTIPLPLVNLCHIPAELFDDEAQRQGRQVAAQPFDLAAGPLLRATLLRFADQDHVLVLVMHHSISDGWSDNILLRELTLLYQAAHLNQADPLPPLPIQYADYARWQRAWLKGEMRDQQVSYWQQQLHGPLPLLDLPTDHPRPTIQAFHGARQSVTFPVTLTKPLKVLSQGEGATLFMTLLAAFQTLLHRYTGQTDLLVGSPIAGRTRTETEALIGCFVNTLVLRTELAGNPRFRALIRQVRDTAFQAYAHQDLPFEMVVEAVHPARDLSRSPLFQVMFVFQNTPQDVITLPGLRLQPLSIDSSMAKFDLTLTMIERPEGLVAHLEYNTELFEAATIDRLLTHFHTLLDGIVADPDCQLADLPLVSPAEYEQLVVAVNATHAAFPEHACLHDLIHTQAQQTPTAIAVVAEDGQLSYQQLTTRASQLAHHLQQLGVGPDVCVGIALERSLDLVVAVLAVLTAGGAYVPLDPSYPRERLRYMQASAQIAVLLTQTQLVARLPPTTAQVICLDRDWPLIAQQPVMRPSSTLHPDNLAYVIYTSGSTGQPKGVQMQHRSVVNFLHAMQQQLGVTSQERVLALTTLSFDPSVLELLLPLTVGAQTLVVSRIVAVDGARLRAVIEQHKLTLLQATPATWRLLLAAGWQSQAGLTLLCGGEALSVDLAQQLRAGGGTLWNVYGPTETTVWSTTASIDQCDGTLPIGRPIANMEMYVLDTQLQIVPTGVRGELYIGGVGLARGYRNRPDLTAERFMPHPFSHVPGARLYRTGDLVRRLPDGQLEYLGRLDHQVKVRGFRIELGEIEAVLARHPAVHACVVMAREDRPGDQQLVGYVVVQTGQELPTVHALRTWLQTSLPEYMVPAAFVFLEHLPLTPNGKVDRRALPAPAETAPSEAFVAPRTSLEQQLATAWTEVLNRTPVGVTDNFFALGGHSLLATQLVTRLRDQLQIELPLRSLFEHPTIADLATYLEMAQAELDDPVPHDPNEQTALLLQPRSDDGIVPLSFAQQRLWFLDQLDPNTAAYTIPATLRLEGQLDEAALEHSFSALVTRHEVLRTTFPLVDEQPVQHIAPPAPCPIARIDLQHLPQTERYAEALRLGQEELQRPFDLVRGPLLRVTLLRLAPDDHLLVLALHHSISDGWSTGVLVRELVTLYRAFHSWQVPTLPPLPIQYADYARWQRDWLQGTVRDQQLAYWRQQLQGPLAVLDLPTDHPRPSIQTFRGAQVTMTLSPELLAALQSLSQREGATLFMTLLAALQTLLYRYIGQTDLLVGSPIAGRTRTETEALIGCFVNTLVLRTDLTGNPRFRELIGRVRDTALQAYAHQDLPFEMVVEAVQSARDLSRSPLFQVMFVLQNTPQEPVLLPGLRLQPLVLDAAVAKFDLTLTMIERPEGLVAWLEYNTDLFEAATMERLLMHFHTLLDGIVVDPDCQLADLPLVSPAEYEQLVVAVNATHAAFPEHACLHELIHAQAQQTPTAFAVVAEDGQLSYQQLTTRASQLAHYLQQLGVGPDVCVGIALERSLDLVVAVLAVLTAGGAYVPLDPS